MSDLFSQPLFSIQKTALDNPERVILHRLMKFGIPSFAVGAGGALMMKLLGDINANQMDARDAAQAENSPGTLVVKLPPEKLNTTKAAEIIADTLIDEGEQMHIAHSDAPEALCFQVADDLTPPAVKLANGPQPGNPIGELLTQLLMGKKPGQDLPVSWTLEAPIDLAAATLPAVAGFKMVDGYFRNREKQQTQEAIKKIKQDYSTMLLRDVQGGPATQEGKSKTASCQAVDCLVDMAVEALEEMSPVKTANVKTAAIPLAPMATSIPALLAILAGVYTHNYTLNKERELDDYYKSKSTPPQVGPTRIKLVSAEPAKVEDSPNLADEPEKKVAFDPMTVSASVGVYDRLKDVLIGEKPPSDSGSPVINVSHRNAPSEPKSRVKEKDGHSVVLKVNPEDDSKDVTVSAGDPGALKFLKTHQKDFVKALS